ncbi:NAD(P)H-dependent flavin oxidoreductase [Sporosarcina newyorkensis]|uniref:NAD(P)H-dependent flavin oxidoreductase n=1 Tax=Sporosarcina newyorkensis TaxID=759851 RepID=UPI0002E882D1|nr:nitronate monooxygenase [Sporosarcina newyorkensis]
MQHLFTRFMEHPIIQAPMAGVTTPKFVAACTEAGALGSIGAGYLTAEDTRQFIREVKKLTDRPFQVNLFVPEMNIVNEEQIEKAYQSLKPIGQQLGLSEWQPTFTSSEFDGQIQVLVDEQVPVCSFTFGLPEKNIVTKLKQHGIFLIGTATTVQEARLAEHAGMDAVVLQGSEAGGHRGAFNGEEDMLPLAKLLTDTVSTIQIPIIAAGGISMQAHIQHVLLNGAEAVQIGTALLATEESGANPHYKKAVLNATENCTVFTKAFSGKTARGIRNTFIEQMECQPIAPYPYQNDLTKPIRSAALREKKPEFMSLWAGVNVHRCSADSVKEVIQALSLSTSLL